MRFGIQIVSLAYDFAGPVARIVASKVTGDAHVPAGMSTWHAAAAPLAQPWSPAEVGLMALRAELLEAAEAQGQAPPAAPRPVWRLLIILVTKQDVEPFQRSLFLLSQSAGTCSSVLQLCP